MFGFKKLQISIITILLTCCLGAIGLLAMNGSIGVDAHTYIVFFSRAGIFCYAYSVMSWVILRRELICTYIIYLTCCYIFMFGQCFFWAFDVQVQQKNLYIRYTDSVMLPAVVFTVLCLMAIHLGAILAAKDVSKNRFENSAEHEKELEYSMQAIKYGAWILFAVSIFPYYYNLFSTVRLVLSSNYKQIYLDAPGSRIDEILEVLEAFYVPSLVMLIVAYPKSKSLFFCVIGLMGVTAAACLIIGIRNPIFTILIGIFLAWHYIKKPIKFWVILLIGILVYALLMASVVVGRVRNNDNRSLDSYIQAYEDVSEKENPVISAFGEMGWTLSNTVEVIKRVGTETDFRYGSSYYYSLTTIVPNLGFWELHPAAANANLASWLQKAMNLNYGPGFSPVAEAYMNFGWFGILFMIFEGFILTKMMTVADRFSLKYNPEAFSLSLTFILCCIKHATRASALVLVRSILYSVLPVYVLFYVVKYTLKRSDRRSSATAAAKAAKGAKGGLLNG